MNEGMSFADELIAKSKKELAEKDKKKAKPPGDGDDNGADDVAGTAKNFARELLQALESTMALVVAIQQTLGTQTQET